MDRVHDGARASSSAARDRRPATSRTMTSSMALVMMMCVATRVFDARGALAQTPTYETIATNGTFTSTRTLAHDEYAYFQFAIPDASSDADVTLEVIDGDADLYVKRPCTSSTCTAPGENWYDWVSWHGSGTDEVFIHAELLSSNGISVGPDKFFRVAVHGWTMHGATFKLSVEIVPENRLLNPTQTAALDGIFTKCCSSTTSCAVWKIARRDGYDPCHWGLAGCTKANETKWLNLQQLDLDCELGSSDFAAFGSSLRRLFVGKNTALKLTDENATIGLLTALPNLIEIDVTGIDLQGRTVDGLCHALVSANLTRIGLSTANVSGALPQCVVDKPQLMDLSMPYNYLTGTLPPLPSSSNLRALYLHEQKSTDSISGVLPPSYVNSTTLEHLYLTDLKLSGTVPDVFLPTGVWREIYLNKNGFNGTIPASLGLQQYLPVLDLSFNAFSGAVPVGIYDHPNRTHVWLKSNKLTRVRVSSIHSPPGASLRLLDASRNLVNETGVSTIFTQMSKLQYLYLNDNKLHGVILDNSTTPVWALRQLDVSENYLEGDIPGASYWGDIFTSSASAGRQFDISQNLYTRVPSWFGAYTGDSGLTITLGSGLYDPSSDADAALASANAKRAVSKFMLALLLITLFAMSGLGMYLAIYIWRQRRSRAHANRFRQFQDFDQGQGVEMA